MSVLSERLAIIIDAETGGAVRGFNQATTASGKLTKEAEQQRATIGRLSLTHDQLAAGLRAGVTTAAVTAGFALVKMARTGIDELKQYQAGLSQLTAGLNSTGNVAHVSTAELEGLARSIQSYSGQTDDSIVQTEALLLRFKNLRNEAGAGNDVFTQTTKIAADMAARLGGDAASQATKLGRALNDPVKGMTALTRVGVQFTDGQKATIQRLVETGRTLDAQKIILRELNLQFAGSAKAYGETLPGQVDRTKRAWEDASQELVTGLLPVMKTAVTVVKGFGAALSNDGVRHTLEFAAALYGVSKAIGLAKAIASSNLITVLKGTSATTLEAAAATKASEAHLANAAAIKAEGAAATATAVQVEELGVAEATGTRVGAGRGIAGGVSRTAATVPVGAVSAIATIPLAGLFAAQSFSGGHDAAGLPGTNKLATESTADLRAELAKLNDEAAKGGIFERRTAETRQLYEAELKSRAATDKHAKSLVEDAAAAHKNAAAISTLNAKLAAHASAALAASGSEDAITEALHAARAATKDNGKELEGNTDKALANRDALRAAASAVLAHADDLKKTGASGREVNAYLLEQSKRLKTAAADIYGNKDAVDKLLKEWDLLPQHLRRALRDFRAEGINAGSALGEGLFLGLQGKSGKVTAGARHLMTDAVRQLNRAAGVAAAPGQRSSARPAEHRARDDRRDGLLRRIAENTKPKPGNTRLGYS